MSQIIFIVSTASCRPDRPRDFDRLGRGWEDRLPRWVSMITSPDRHRNGRVTSNGILWCHGPQIITNAYYYQFTRLNLTVTSSSLFAVSLLNRNWRNEILTIKWWWYSINIFTFCCCLCQTACRFEGGSFNYVLLSSSLDSLNGLKAGILAKRWPKPWLGHFTFDLSGHGLCHQQANLYLAATLLTLCWSFSVHEIPTNNCSSRDWCVAAGPRKHCLCNWGWSWIRFRSDFQNIYLSGLTRYTVAVMI